jgi:hypothetical protein
MHLINETHPIVNVTAILADPFSLPVFTFLFLLLSRRLTTPEYHLKGSSGSRELLRQWLHHKGIAGYNYQDKDRKEVLHS